MLVLFLAPVINTETVFWVTYVQWSWEEFISQYPIKVNVYPYTKELLNTYVSTNIYTYWIHKSSFNQMMVQEKINFSTRLAISRNTIWHKYLFRIKAKKDKNVDHKVEDSFFFWWTWILRWVCWLYVPVDVPTRVSVYLALCLTADFRKKNERQAPHKRETSKIKLKNKHMFFHFFSSLRKENEAILHNKCDTNISPFLLKGKREKPCFSFSCIVSQ